MIQGRVVEFLYLLLITSSMLFLTSRARKGWNPDIRRIAGLEAVEEAVARCTEMGRPVFYSPGGGDVTDASTAQTIAGLNVLSYVAQYTAKYDVPIIVGVRQANTYVLAHETVKQSYATEGKPDSFKADGIQFLSPEQFAYAAGCAGLIQREQAGAVFLIGFFQAESLYLAEAASAANAISVSGTTRLTQLPMFIAACDYTLIGEEMLAASAYLSKDPAGLAIIGSGDIAKIVAVILVALSAIVSTTGSAFMKTLLSR